MATLPRFVSCSVTLIKLDALLIRHNISSSPQVRFGQIKKKLGLTTGSPNTPRTGGRAASGVGSGSNQTPTKVSSSVLFIIRLKMTDIPFFLKVIKAKAKPSKRKGRPSKKTSFQEIIDFKDADADADDEDADVDGLPQASLTRDSPEVALKPEALTQQEHTESHFAVKQAEPATREAEPAVHATEAAAVYAAEPTAEPAAGAAVVKSKPEPRKITSINQLLLNDFTKEDVVTFFDDAYHYISDTEV